MDLIELLIGTGKELNALQMSVRTLIIFILALSMLRIAGVRTFGKKSTFDMVIMIMLGAVLSRAITAASPFMPTIIASFVMVIIHRLLGWISYKNDWINQLVNGKRTLLYKKGQQYQKNMQKVQISKDDVMEEIRLQLYQDELKNIDEVWLEKTGKVSILETQH